MSDISQLIISGDHPSAIILQYRKDGSNHSKNLNSFSPDEFDAAIQSGIWMNNLFYAELQKDLKFSELFNLSNCSLWWHWVTWAHETDSIINAKTMISLSERLLTCCAAINPNQVSYFGSNLWLSEIISNVCETKNINYQYIGSRKQVNLRYWQPLIKLLRFLIRKILWDINISRYFQKNSKNSFENKKRILLCSGDTWSVKSNHNEKILHHDVHYGSIVDGLEKKYSVYFVQLIPKYRFLLRGIFKKIFTESTVYQPFESYLKWKDIITVAKQHFHLRKKWKDVGLASSWSAKFASNDVSCNWWIKKCVNYYLAFPVLEHLLCFKASRNMIEKIEPNYILLSGEWGCYSLSLVIQANIRGVPVDALQHGFTSRAVSTNHLSSALDLRGSGGPSPLANYYLLYGEFYKNLLVQYANIPADRCRVVGAPRFDKFTLNLTSRINARKKIIGDQEKYVVLISVANVQSGYKYETLRQILSSLRDIDGTYLIVKLHPEESEKIDEYELAASSVGVSVIFKTGYGLLDLLAGCDLFITEFSTAVLESAMSEVETVLIDFHSIGYAKFYENHPFLVEINNGTELAAYVRNRMRDPSKTSSVLAHDFIKSHLYKIDGLSTHRLINFVENRIN